MIRSLFLAALLAGLSFPAAAADFAVGAIEIDQPFARSSPRIANAGAGYMVLRNTGKEPDRLVAAEAAVSKAVELHTVERDGDVMTMKPIPAIDLPAGAAVELKPGSFHVMFMNLHAPLQEGATIPLTLRFEKAGTVPVSMPVKAVAAMSPGGGHVAEAPLPAGDVVVLAAGPLAGVMGKAKEAFAARVGATVGLASGHSPAHAKQLMAGAPADLFVGADGPWVQELVDAGKLVRDSLAPLAGNTLILVARADSPLSWSPGEPLADKLAGGKLGIADPAVAPAGQYARAALGKLGVLDAVAPGLALHPNLKAVVAAVESGDVAAGIVLASDAHGQAKLRRVAAFPPDSYPPVRTMIALVAGRDNAKARAFYDFLRSPDGRALLAAHGFQPQD